VREGRDDDGTDGGGFDGAIYVVGESGSVQMVDKRSPTQGGETTPFKPKIRSRDDLVRYAGLIGA